MDGKPAYVICVRYQRGLSVHCVCLDYGTAKKVWLGQRKLGHECIIVPTQIR